MTQRESEDDRDYPDGSVGRYVRERWGTVPAKATRPYIGPVQPAPLPEPEIETLPAPTAPQPEDRDETTPPSGVPQVAAVAPVPSSAGPEPARYGPVRPEPGHREPAPARSEPGQHEPGGSVPTQVEPGRHESALAEPVRTVPGRLEPVRTDGHQESAQPEPARPEPGQHEHGGSVPTRVEPGRHESALAEPVRTGPGRPDPVRTEPGHQPEPARPEPGQYEPGQHEPGRTAPARPELARPDTARPEPVPGRPEPARPGRPAPVSGGPAGATAPGHAGPPPRPLSDGAPRTPAREAARWTDPGAVAAQQAQQARNPDLPTADLSSARLLRPSKRPPQSGWRRLVYVLSGRMLNPGESPHDIRRRELTGRVNRPLIGCHKIAMLSLKGGVGKTTTTATLGATFASLRGDRVVAVDANPDRGTLSQKIPLETSATVRHLLRDAQRVRRYTDVRAYTSQGPSRLEVLASEQDPAVSEAFSEDDYRRTVNLLEHFYNIVLTDCGTGLMHSAMYGVLGVADQLIIVSSGSIDGARSASATMDWLDAHGHGDLVANSVAVINCVHRSAGGVDLDRVAEHFAARCRAVVRIPFDAHLEEGAEVDLDRLEGGTRMALLELAAAVADAFEGPPTG